MPNLRRSTPGLAGTALAGNGRMWERRSSACCVFLTAVGMAFGCSGATQEGTDTHQTSAGNAGMAATVTGGDADGLSGSEAGGAAAGNGAEAATECAGDDGTGPLLWITYVGPATLYEGYQGSALVEQSAPDALLLDFESSSGAHQMRIMGGGSVSARALPLFPTGALVWLQARPAGMVPTPDNFGGAAGPYYVAPSAWNVRDQQNGIVLLGGAFNSKDSASPIEIGDAIDGCVEPNPECHGPDAQRIHQSLELLGDQVVYVQDGQTGTVTLNGLEYWAHVNAYRDTTGALCAAPANYYASPKVSWRLSLQLKDPELLIAGLPQREPPG